MRGWGKEKGGHGEPAFSTHLFGWGRWGLLMYNVHPRTLFAPNPNRPPTTPVTVASAIEVDKPRWGLIWFISPLFSSTRAALGLPI